MQFEPVPKWCNGKALASFQLQMVVVCGCVVLWSAALMVARVVGVRIAVVEVSPVSIDGLVDIVRFRVSHKCDVRLGPSRDGRGWCDGRTMIMPIDSAESIEGFVITMIGGGTTVSGVDTAMAVGHDTGNTVVAERCTAEEERHTMD
ncbi:hypothetical protein RHMOL_Rhmol04G0160200 [Rhododendron molle]|uniref:Uncharacterized protein n=1 Tax=Rhododendron molle TaxID=49168 RepID=A0ACC0P245_RHOML|nr:hypothetical protein RHMOL_Rhmol04G0160200 [Rhododendron molle]